MKKKITHNKLKNTGLLFEMLIRQITSDMMAGKESPAVPLISKYFSPVTDLGKELELYKILISKNNLTESKASHLIDLVIKQYNQLNEKKINIQKYSLIKEIQSKYDLKTFLSTKIPEYKSLASIYKLFSSSDVDSTIINLNEVVESRFLLIEHLTKNASVLKEEQNYEFLLNESEGVRLLTYKLMINKFNEKYKDLSLNQKKLIKEYIININNNSKLKVILDEHITIVSNGLRNKLSKLDDILHIKVNEVVSNLDKIKLSKKVRDTDVSAVLIAHQLNQELE